MAKYKNNASRNFGNKKERQIGKKQNDPDKLLKKKRNNTIWTIAILVLLLIAFIVNNTRDVPESGPYPPFYDPAKVSNNN